MSDITDVIQERILEEVTSPHGVLEGAYNTRVDERTTSHSTMASIDITTKTDKPGIDIRVKLGTRNESVRIPAVISASGLKEMVYNNFFIGDDSDVVIIADCGIHNCGDQDSKHDDVHRFFVGRNAKVKYVEKHYGEGDDHDKCILNSGTEVYMEKNSSMEMGVTQIKGVDSTNRTNTVELAPGAKLVVRERLLTHGIQEVGSTYIVNPDGDDSSADVVSCSVAKDNSKQTFNSKIVGNTKCSDHTECDAITVDDAKIFAMPSPIANNIDAVLIHKAAASKITGEQIMKLMIPGLTGEETEAQIVSGFLK